MCLCGEGNGVFLYLCIQFNTAQLNMKKIYLIILLVYCSINLKSQPILLNGKNTPKAECTYIYKKIKFNYANAIHAGPDTIWNFSDIEIQSDSTYDYYTRNPEYESFPGIYDFVTVDPPDPSDTTYLRSDNAIYRLTDSLFYQAYFLYNLIQPPNYATFIDDGVFPVFRFPFQYNSFMNMGSTTSYSDYTKWKKGDAYGTIIIPDSTYSDVLRTNTYFDYFQEAGMSHDSYGRTTNTYEWYTDDSELPLMKVVVSDSWTMNSFGGSGLPNHTYDTTAWIFTTKINHNLPDSIFVFPCPAYDWVYLKTYYDVNKLSIYNIEGRLVSELFNLPGKIKHPIEIINLEKGIYILRGELSNGKSFYKKIIVGS